MIESKVRTEIVKIIYRWRGRFAGTAADDVKELKNLPQKNARLKKPLAGRDIEIEIMEKALTKKLVRAPLHRVTDF